MTTSEMTTSETSKASETKHEASGCACELHELPAPRTANPRDQATRPSVGSRTHLPLAGRVPILSSRNRASPTSVLADEKMMPKKEPILALAEEKTTSDETRRHGKAGIYEQVVQKKGQPLREGFTIVKVRGTCASLTHAHLPLSPNCEATASQLGDWISHAHLPRSPNCETTVSQLGDWISEI